MTDLEEEQQKVVIKEAIKEWLQEKITEFGWWSLKTIGALAIAGVVYLALISSGWHR